MLAERFSAALHRQSLDAGDDTDHGGHDRRLDDADDEMIDRDGVAQPQQERFGIDAAIEPGHEATAIKCGHGAEERQDRQRQHQCQHPRQDQHLDRIEAHGAQRIDLLAHLHRAELGGICRARTARHHDRDQQHADLAQHQHAEHVDDENIGTELTEMENALLRDDAADQKRDQHHDRHRAPAHLFQVMDSGGQAEAAGMDDDVAGRGQHRAQHVDQSDQGAADPGHAAADLLQHA